MSKAAGMEMVWYGKRGIRLFDNTFQQLYSRKF